VASEVASDQEWDAVSEESPDRVVFDKHGDEFVGTYEGRTTIKNPKGDDFDQLLFRGLDRHLYAINPGYKVEQAFQEIKIGTMTKLVYIKDVDVGQASPMKDIQVFAAKK
jgi:hypothetical protein